MRATRFTFITIVATAMGINKDDVVYETMRGRGAGGQHKNKTDSCVRATHKPTGISVRIDGRDQSKNKKAAFKELEKRVQEAKDKEKAKIKIDWD